MNLIQRKSNSTFCKPDQFKLGASGRLKFSLSYLSQFFFMKNSQRVSFVPKKQEESGINIPPGTEIKGYVVGKCIGSGGYAAVYLVTSQKFNKTFVAKVILPKDQNLSKAWESFDSEINSLLKLDYPHIIRLYDHFSVNNLFFLILEYCSRGSLYGEVCECGPLKAMRLMNVTKQLISAVYNAHKNNIAHRDIKPHNILFDDFGRVKLADFGISVYNNNNESTQNFNCSPAFGAPEVLRKEPHDPFKADIWSLGVTLYYAASGTLPFKFHNVSQILTDMKVLGPTLSGKLIPPQIFNLIKRMIVYDPNQRITIDEAYHEICDQNKDFPSKIGNSIIRFPSLKSTSYEDDGYRSFNTGISTATSAFNLTPIQQTALPEKQNDKPMNFYIKHRKFSHDVRRIRFSNIKV